MKVPACFLAPISEYTNLPFRLLCKKYGAEATVVPLVSATALAKREEMSDTLDLSKDEKNAGVQLFGSEPEDFKKAAKAIERNFPFVSWLDINCGCPMKKITENGAGASLLKSPKLVGRIIEATKDAGLPVSVKMRLLPKIEKTIGFCRAVEKTGIEFLVLHGRTAKQMYSGAADWEAIKKAHASIGLPVIGNGDITDKAKGEELVSDGYCDGFMIGRAAMRNPLCFSNKNLNSLKAEKKLFLEYAKICERYGSLKPNDLKQKALFFFRSCKNCASIRRGISKTKTIDEIFAVINNF